MDRAMISTDADTSYAAGVLDDLPDDLPLLELVGRVVEQDSHEHRFDCENSDIMAKINRLTRRERQVMYLLYAGKSMKLIAFELGISKQTVAKHRTSILEKMDLRGEAELARLLTLYALHRS